MADVEMKGPEVSTPTDNRPESSRNEETAKRSDRKRVFEMQIGSKGIYLGFFLLICAMVASIIAQQYVRGHFNTSSDWLSHCPEGYDEECVGNSAVYRFSFALVVIYAVQLLGSTIHVDFFDNLWVFKFIAFIGIVIGFFYANASTFDDRGYAWFARFAGFFYVILQQIILIDFAFTINEKLLAMAAADTESNKWYAVILGMAITLFCGAYAVIGIMFWQFTGCVSNDVILSLTLALTIIATFIQVFASEEGSILTSAIMTAYATYVCYSAVTLNPRSSCNPTISTSYQEVSTAIGLALTVLSLSWTAYNAVSKIPGALKNVDPNAGLGAPKATTDAPSLRVIFQEVSVVFILISAYYCMVLTNWATLQSSSSISDPLYGDVALWLQASAQWIAILLYIWTLFAPKIFPDREF